MCDDGDALTVQLLRGILYGDWLVQGVPNTKYGGVYLFCVFHVIFVAIVRV